MSWWVAKPLGWVQVEAGAARLAVPPPGAKGRRDRTADLLPALALAGVASVPQGGPPGPGGIGPDSGLG